MKQKVSGFITLADGSKIYSYILQGLNTRMIRENDKVVFDIQKKR